MTSTGLVGKLWVCSVVFRFWLAGGGRFCCLLGFSVCWLLFLVGWVEFFGRGGRGFFVWLWFVWVFCGFCLFDLNKERKY